MKYFDVPSNGFMYFDSCGSEFWTQDRSLHREDGPAVIFLDGTQEWYQHGKLHRDNGPAIIHTNGNEEWWLYGCQVFPKYALI